MKDRIIVLACVAFGLLVVGLAWWSTPGRKTGRDGKDEEAHEIRAFGMNGRGKLRLESVRKRLSLLTFLSRVEGDCDMRVTLTSDPSVERIPSASPTRGGSSSIPTSRLTGTKSACPST